MNKPIAHSVDKAVDGTQQRITDYACGLNYASLPTEVIGGFFGDPSCVSRNLAAQMPSPDGATIIGTRMKSTPDMAAFVNATTARYVEMNDTYHWPGSYQGHPSDVVMPILAAAEHAQVNGREFINGIVLGYEVFLRVCDVFHNRGFDNANFSCLGTAVAAGKLMGLSAAQLSHCVSMAVVPNNILRQVRTGHLSMFKAASAGQGGRAGVFAAMLARAGMAWGGRGEPFKILYSQIKNRPCPGVATSCVLAAEKVAPVRNISDVTQVTVEIYKYAKDLLGTGEHHWNPESRESADHSAPYLVAATLIDGTVTPRSYNDARLWNPELRALIKKVEIVENREFTKAYEKMPQEHRTRVTVVTANGGRLVGESGGDKDDLASPRSDTQIAEKFRGLTEDFLGAKPVNAILDCLWHLEDMRNVAAIPPAFVIC